jgi:REP element-mobilizing transposase RayT
MARRLRIQFEGAVYHVINRGNYRRDVFETADKATAFERTLFETCDRMRWRLHAYVLMRNHYHLALETPEPNLVDGMHWLQGTFAVRFNHFRKEQGHLFQGRYRSLLIEPGQMLNRVVDYIHLNPVRAGIIPAQNVADFRWGSLRRFVRNDRPACLSPETWLATSGLSDNAEDWKTHVHQLVQLAGTTDRQKELGFGEMSQGWAIGTTGWRKAMAQEHSRHALASGIPAREIAELKAHKCAQVLETLLVKCGKNRADAATEPKGALWKIGIAAAMRKSTPATNRWITETLHMGPPNAVSQYLSRVKRGQLIIQILEA